MQHLPWPDNSFDVVTSFRGIWGTTPDAVAEAYRVLAPGGRLGITVWGHIKRSPGAWSLEPLALASTPQVEHQAAMVALGRPGAGEELLAQLRVRRHRAPRDSVRRRVRRSRDLRPRHLLGGSGIRGDRDHRRGRVRPGGDRRCSPAGPRRPPASRRDRLWWATSLASRRRPSSPTPGRWPATSFLDHAPPSAGAQRLFDDDVQGMGYVMNVSKLWAHDPPAMNRLVDLLGHVTEVGFAHLPPTRHPDHGVRLGHRRLVLLARLGQEARQQRRRRSRRERAARRRLGTR